MKMQAILPLVTYPDANSDAVAANAVAVAAYLGADLHAVALNADIPDVSNALSRVASEAARAHQAGRESKPRARRTPARQSAERKLPNNP